jgi:glycosyltransferase involved in cell wall biosynthesis
MAFSPLPSNAVILAFEGPDPYSMVGGLGTRVTEMSAALAEAGIKTTLIFVGDPERQAVEQAAPNLEYRRWCQWISRYHASSVYDGEQRKMNDFTASAPAFVLERIIEPAVARAESVFVMTEDWQMAPIAIAINAALQERRLRHRAVLVWNANNTYGFNTIDWPALAQAACITTVSRYMKFELAARGVEALVVPNGIPIRLLEGASKKLVRTAVKVLSDRRPLFVKVARFDPEKGWMQAVEAFANIVKQYPEATFVMRGGREAYGDEVCARARELGLHVEDLTVASREPQDVLDAIVSAPGSVINIRSFVPEEALHVLYHVADAVLANSAREPFGLVGLEVMAVGGVAVTGSTGEDYVEPYENAYVCDTGDPHELTALLEDIVTDHDRAHAVATAGETTAARYIWPRVLEMLERRLSFVSPEVPESASETPVSRGRLRLVQPRRESAS